MILALLGVALAHESLPADTPDWRVDRFLPADGLPLDHLNDLVLDPRGYLWITTFDGLARFDGDAFVTYRRGPVLRSNRTVDVVLDAQGRLVFNDEVGTLYRADPAAFAPEVIGEGVSHVFRLGDALWANGAHRVWRIDAAPVERLRLPDDDVVVTLGPGEPGEVLVRTPTALHRVGAEVTAVALPTAPGPLVDEVHDVTPVADARGEVWLVHERALRRVRGGLVSDVDLGEVRLVCGLFLDHGVAWADTDRGLVALLSGGPAAPVGPAGCGEVRLVDGDRRWHVANDALYLDDARITDVGRTVPQLRADGAGGVWLATHRGLVHVRPAIATHPTPITSGVDGVRVDDAGVVWAFDKDGPVAWTGGALTRVEPGVVVGGALRERPGGGVFAVGRGQRWEADLDGLRAVEPLPPGRYDPGRTWVDAGGRAWLAGVDALYTRDGGAWREVRTADGGAIGDVRDVVRAGSLVAVLSGGQGLLVGPIDGLRRADAVPSVDLRGAWVDGGALWLATEDAGLCRVDLPHAALRCASEADGLGDHNVHNGTFDAAGRLWMGTNRGVLVAERAALDAFFDGVATTLSTIRLDERDGMARRETNGGQWAFDVDADGGIWFPTMGGPARVDPARLARSTPLAVALEAVFVGDVARPPPLALTSDEREVRARWSVPEFVRPEQVQFRYRMTGVDADWRGPSAAREATWTNVPAGDHAIEVQARLGGDWGPVARVALSRAPTFLETPAFPLSLMLAAAGGTALAAAAWGRERRRREVALEAEVARRTAELRERNAAILAQTAQLEAQSRELAAVDAAKTRFVANLSHELRTPMMLVMGPLQDLAEDPALGAVGDRVRLAARNAERLKDLVDQLFDVVRLDAGRLPMRARRLDLGAFIDDLVGRYGSIAEGRGIALAARVAPVEVWADPDLLEKAVGNLLGNALKFTPRGGRVEVSVEAGEEHVAVRVVDDGPGVPADARDKVFDRFYQASAGDARTAEGAGIGLSLAKELVELHGGTLGLEPSDRGARFVVTLPIGARHLAVSDIALEGTPAASIPAPVAEDGRPRVLVVEDHAELRAYLAARLAEEFAVEQAEDGEAALKRLAQGGISLLLSDIMMPGTDGLALCRAVRADPALAGLPIVLLSAKGRNTEPEALAAGADAFLPKPVRTSDLLAALRARLPARPVVEEEEEEPGPRSEVDAALLVRIEGIAKAELQDPEFSVERLAKRVAMSRRTLQRALNRLTGKAPTAWLQELRLEAGREVLLRGGTVGEAAAAVGLSPSYFTRLYGAWYGHPPSEEVPRRPERS